MSIVEGHGKQRNHKFTADELLPITCKQTHSISVFIAYATFALNFECVVALKQLTFKSEVNSLLLDFQISVERFFTI